MVFENFQFLAQIPKGLAFGFNEKCQFAAKIDQNSAFLGPEAQISDQLHIMVPYKSFYRF
jgi:hypothetical protein